MERKGWYLVAYDIANPSRLKKVHKHLKKNGIAAQKSVFFVRGTESRVNILLNEIETVMDRKEDDLRAYPIINPKEVWVFGPNPLADYPVVDFDSKPERAASPEKHIRFKQLSGLYDFKKKLFSLIGR